jgi:predicted TIM-barrel fold metal-dependent hydrolase
VLSFVPSTRADEPLTIEEATATAAWSRRWKGPSPVPAWRVNPNQPGDVEDMERLAKAVPHRGVENLHAMGTRTGAGSSWTIPGLRMIEEARRLGCGTSPIHKGAALSPTSYEHSTCADIGRVRKRYPDVNFLIYHSGS